MRDTYLLIDFWCASKVRCGGIPVKFCVGKFERRRYELAEHHLKSNSFLIWFFFFLWRNAFPRNFLPNFGCEFLLEAQRRSITFYFMLIDLFDSIWLRIFGFMKYKRMEKDLHTVPSKVVKFKCQLMLIFVPHGFNKFLFCFARRAYEFLNGFALRLHSFKTRKPCAGKKKKTWDGCMTD